MEKIKKVIFKDINNIICLLKKNKSISTYPYLITDLVQLQDLCDDLGIEGYPDFEDTNVFLDAKKYNDNAVNTIAESYLIDYDFIYKLLSKVNNFYDTNPTHKMYDDNPKVNLQLPEMLDLAVEFLTYFDKRYLNTFLRIYNEKKLIMVNPNDGDFGLTYNGYAFSPYIVFENRNNLLTVETIVHEVAHAFSTHLIGRIDFKHQYNHYLTNTVEICSYSTELFFIQYLLDNHILPEDTQRLINQFNRYLQYDAATLIALFNEHDEYFCATEKTDSMLSNFYGRTIGTYLFGLNDKEKALYLIDRISIESCKKILTDIIIDNGMDLKDISNFRSGKRVLRKLWKEK